MEKPNCAQCRHFYITFDPKTPNGCRRFGIKCKETPSRVITSAGLGDCQGFEMKKRPEDKDVRLNLNHRELW